MLQPIRATCGVTRSVPGRPRKHPSGWEQAITRICISKTADTDRRLMHMIQIIQWTSVKFIYNIQRCREGGVRRVRTNPLFKLDLKIRSVYLAGHRQWVL